MKRSFYSFIVATSLIGSVARAEPSVHDLPKPSEPKEATWLEVVFCAAITAPIVYCTYQLYQSTKNLK